MAADEFVLEEKHGDFVVIRWNRPDRKNAITPEMQLVATNHLNRLAKDESVKLVVLTGTGDYFTRGADILGSNPSEADISVEANERKIDIFKDLVDCLIDFPKPLIAAVNGPALGMGATILPLCDVVYASSDSIFVTPFSKIGLVPEACSTYTFPRIMGNAKANEMLMFNRSITASEALSCGLVAGIFPKQSLMDEVDKRVHEFLDNSYMSMICCKQLIRDNDRQKLREVNEAEVKVLKERAKSSDLNLHAMKSVVQRVETQLKKNTKV